jgi:hypothetical protein
LSIDKRQVCGYDAETVHETTGEAAMTLAQIVSLARSMMTTLRNGCTRAIRFLRQLGHGTEFIRWALLGR